MQSYSNGEKMNELDFIFTISDARWNSNENCTATLNITNATFLGQERCYPKFGKTENCTYIQTAATQYWERFVLNLTEGGLGEPGNNSI